MRVVAFLAFFALAIADGAPNLERLLTSITRHLNAENSAVSGNAESIAAGCVALKDVCADVTNIDVTSSAVTNFMMSGGNDATTGGGLGK